MSALPLKADIVQYDVNVRFVPLPDSSSAAKEMHRLQGRYAVAAVRDYGIASSHSISLSARTATLGSALKLYHRLNRYPLET